MDNKMVGVIGGMGSHAAHSFFHELIADNKADRDQDYVEIVLHNNTKIPDRTSGILCEGPSPLPELLRSAELLEKSGASIIVMACITAYYYADKIEECLQTSTLYHIINETVNELLLYKGINTVGLFASEGTIKTGIWERALIRQGLRVVTLSPNDYERYFIRSIYGSIKSGIFDDFAKKRVVEGCTKLTELGADLTIGACSELPLVVRESDFSFPYIDVMRLSARKILEMANR